MDRFASNDGFLYDQRFMEVLEAGDKICKSESGGRSSKCGQ
jgi:hypothetical protein